MGLWQSWVEHPVWKSKPFQDFSRAIHELCPGVTHGFFLKVQNIIIISSSSSISIIICNTTRHF